MNLRSFILTVVMAVLVALFLEGGSKHHAGPAVVKSPSISVTILPTAHTQRVKRIYGKHPDPSPGDVLNAHPGTWQNASSYTYQWQNCSILGSNCDDIANATSGSYTVTGGDIGKTIRVMVTAHNSRGSTSDPSPPTITVTPIAGTAPINTVQPYFAPGTVDSSGNCTAGCAIQGQQLQATAGAWLNSPTSFDYQWQDCTTAPAVSTGVHVSNDSSSGYWMTLPSTGSCTNATGTGATTNTYTVGSSDVGKALSVQVTAVNGSGSTPTTSAGTCDTGLMTTQMAAVQGLPNPPASTYFDNGQPGCSPISAVVGSSQFGTGTSGEHFCTNAPITCGFADIANTGPPAGTTFQSVPSTCTSPSGPGPNCGDTGSGWTYIAPDFIETTSGATVKNVVFEGQVLIGCCHGAGVGGVNNVIVEDSDLENNGDNAFIFPLGGASTNVTIQNNDIHGLDALTLGHGCAVGIRDVYGDVTSVTVQNNNIWYCGTGINPLINGTNEVHSNYVHDFAFSSSDITTPGFGDHFDGIQFEGNGGQNESPFPFDNNTLLMDAPQTSPITLSTDSNTGNVNRQIIHNLVAGGDYCIYAGAQTFPTTDSTFSRNVFSSIYVGNSSTTSADNCGTFGPVANWNPPTNTWTNNIWDRDGSTVAP